MLAQFSKANIFYIPGDLFIYCPLFPHTDKKDYVDSHIESHTFLPLCCWGYATVL